MRLYGLYLEHRLADVTTRIETTDSDNAGMEEQYSALLSPSRIYNYARAELDMTTVQEVEIIKIHDGTDGAVRLANAGSPEAEDAGDGPGGFFGFFIGRANAKD